MMRSEKTIVGNGPMLSPGCEPGQRRIEFARE